MTLTVAAVVVIGGGGGGETDVELSKYPMKR